MSRARHERSRGVRGHGFSLVEVMVALAIFAIGLLAILPLFGMATYGTQNGRDLSRATALARSYVDKLRSIPYSQVGDCPGPAGNPSNVCVAPAAEVTANLPYTVTWTVQTAAGGAYPFPPAAPPSPDMKRIQVTVTCTSCANRTLRVRMTTIISARS